MYNIKSSSIFYGFPKRDFHEKLWNILLKKHSTIKNVSKVFGLSIRQVYKWKEGKNCYPLSTLNRLVSEVNLRIENSLVYIKTSRASDLLYDPKISFQSSSKLVEFVGHLLHDGGIDHGFRVHYTTHSKKAADRFISLVKDCFGRTKVELREEQRKITLYFPAVIGKIINDVFNIPKGSKVKNNVSIPEFVFKLKKDDQWLYICVAYFCDGVKDRVSIVSSSNSIYRAPNLLLDSAKILKSLGIKTIEIRPSEIYKLKDGSNHRRWILNIKNPDDKKMFLSKYHAYRLLL